MATEKAEHVNVFAITPAPRPATDPEEFKRFHELMTQGRPGYSPWYIPLGKGEVVLKEKKTKEGTTKVTTISGKDPSLFGKWKDEKNRLTFEQAYKRLQNGFNVGAAATDTDPYVILDVDDMGLVGNTKPTLQAISRKRLGRHNYYITEEPARGEDNPYETTAKDNIPLDDAGELRSCWQYVVAPGSFVPCGPGEYNSIPEEDKHNAGKYSLLNPIEPTNITFNELPDIFREKRIADIENAIEHEYKNEQKQRQEPGDKQSKSGIFELTPSDVLGYSYSDFEKFPSPLHGSSTGANASFTGDLLHCWRHNVSHSGYSLLAVQAGLYDCGEAGKPHKGGCSYLKYDGEEIFQVWKYAKEQGILPPEDPIPVKALVYFAVANSICRESDIVDGWKLPTDDYNISLLRLRDSGLEPGRHPQQKEKATEEDTTQEDEDPALKAAKVSQQAKKEMGVYRILAESERISACRVIWEKHGLNGHDFKKAYDEVFRPKKKEKEEPDIEETPEHIKERAKDIAHNGNPLNFIIATHQDLHVGDIGLATTLILSTTCQHVLNTNGIQPKLSGASGKGKSDCAMSAAHLLPQEWLLTSSLSNKAIYYMEEKLKPGTVVFLDDVILGEDMEKVINRATTFYQTGAQHTTLDINRQNVTLKIPPRLAWWLTSIDDDQSLQLLNRTFGGEVDESHEQDKRVAIRQREKAKTGEVGLPINDNILICREIIRDIKQNTYIVKIPFADAIIWRDENNRRNQPMFLDIIKAFAVLRHRQREKDPDGALLATYQDYIDAKMLYTSRQEAQKTKLTAAERKLCEVLSENGSLTFQGLCKELNVGKSRLSQILNGKGKGHDSGALFKVKELWEEECTVKNITGGYTKQKLYGYDGEFNPLEGYESVVDFDNAVYPVYPVFTPCLPYKIDSGSIVFTLFTLNEITEQGNIIPSNIVEEVEDKKTKEVQKNEDNDILLTEHQKKGKQGKQKAYDSETPKVNKGKHEGKQPSRILLDTVRKYCRGWEPVKKTSINSQNYMEVVTDYLKGYKLSEDMRGPVEAAVMIYAKIPQPLEVTP